jgi:hypothetical protein
VLNFLPYSWLIYKSSKYSHAVMHKITRNTRVSFERGFCWLYFLKSMVLINLSHGPKTSWKSFWKRELLESIVFGKKIYKANVDFWNKEGFLGNLWAACEAPLRIVRATKSLLRLRQIMESSPGLDTWTIYKLHIKIKVC